MMEEQMSESIEAGAPSIKYDQGDIRMGQGGDEQGRQVAAQIWEQMEQEQKVQFGSFDAFFESGIWKQIIQQMQADQGGGVGPGSEMMSENVNIAESMPGGGIADVDMNEQVQMAANGGRMGYNMGGGADMGAPQMNAAGAKEMIVAEIMQKLQSPNVKDRDRAILQEQLKSLVSQPKMPRGGIADVNMREQVQMRANGGLMSLYNRGM